MKIEYAKRSSQEQHTAVMTTVAKDGDGGGGQKESHTCIFHIEIFIACRSQFAKCALLLLLLLSIHRILNLNCTTNYTHIIDNSNDCEAISIDAPSEWGAFTFVVSNVFCLFCPTETYAIAHTQQQQHIIQLKNSI